MSFLGLRRSRPRLSSTSSDAHPDGASTQSIKSTSTFRKRLSSLTVLVPKRLRAARKSTHACGVGYTAGSPYAAYSRSRSPSPEPSLEIRRPSGLGRRASITSEQWWADDAEIRPPERKRSASTPELSLVLRVDAAPGKTRTRWDALSETVRGDESPVKAAPQLPLDVLQICLEYVPREELGGVARACKAFWEVARVRLYRDVDLLGATQRQVDKCVNVLAQKRELAAVVDRFACTALPPADTSGATSPLPAVTFAIALNNMHNLTRLTLSRFDSALLFHTTFRLQEATFLCSSTSQNELEGLFAWLTNQSTLTSLSFPRLSLDDEASQWLAGAGSQLSDIPENEDPEDSAPSTLCPSTLLPALNSIHGPTQLVMALVPGRPVASATVHLHTTIYDGLRPSALVAELSRSTGPLTSLSLIASPESRIDARTIERVITAAGAELGTTIDTLDVACALDVQVLHKQASGALPRFRRLHTLRLRRTVGERVAFPSAAPPVSELPVRTQEHTLLAAWSKHCPGLNAVVFPSGGEWCVREGIGGRVWSCVGVVA